MQLEEFLRSVGQRIRTIRKDRGINQQTLAMMCDFEKSNMSRIEAGRCNLTLKNILKIADALNVNACDIIGPTK